VPRPARGPARTGGVPPCASLDYSPCADRQDQLVFLPCGPGEARTRHLPGFAVATGGWFADGRRMWLIVSEEKKLLRAHVLETESGSPRPISPEGLGFRGAISPEASWWTRPHQAIDRRCI